MLVELLPAVGTSLEAKAQDRRLNRYQSRRRGPCTPATLRRLPSRAASHPRYRPRSLPHRDGPLLCYTAPWQARLVEKIYARTIIGRPHIIAASWRPFDTSQLHYPYYIYRRSMLQQLVDPHRNQNRGFVSHPTDLSYRVAG